MFRIAIDENVSPKDEILQREWLETNGLGGYSSSTILNCHTRKYHGLLVANLKDPPGRFVLLSTVEDSLRAGNEEYFLSCHQYPDYFFPPVRNHFTEFRLDRCPTFIFRTDNFCLDKSIMMIHGTDCVLIRYEVEHCPSPATLCVKPFLAFRNHHGLAKENRYLKTQMEAIRNGFAIAPYEGMPALWMRTNVKSGFKPGPVWYRKFEHAAERERGYDWQEDLFLAGVFEIPVKAGTSIIISASLERMDGQLARMWKAEEARRLREEKRDGPAGRGLCGEDAAHMRNLERAGGQFVIKTPSERPAVVAGYHWFGEWGRDQLISLPGITFCRGLFREGIDILVSFAAYEKDGLLPNFFSEDGQGQAYNTVDAPLWFFWAVQQMLAHSGEIGIIERKLWPVMKRIIERFLQGTVFGIHAPDNGLLSAGNGGPALTWMDATIQGRPVTPRWGCAVEINALWYNAICFASALAQRFNEPDPYSSLIPRIRRSFQETFWIREEEYLGDVFRDGFLNRSVRPNQIFAVSLPYSPLDPQQWAGVMRKVTEHLLTPCGLRTLAPDEPGYRSRYEGDTASRDRAYHQGTVWPWLLAHFGEAYLRAAEDKAAARDFLINHMRSFLRRHMMEAGIGCVSEVFDGDPPHRPNGCITQSWSVAELIRLLTILKETATQGECAGCVSGRQVH